MLSKITNAHVVRAEDGPDEMTYKLFNYIPGEPQKSFCL